MSSDDIAIRISNLSKCYQIYDRPNDRLKQSIYPRLQRFFGRPPRNYFRQFWALKDISFEIKKGETIGIIGRNGAGKSTLLQLICGTISQSSGNIETRGRIAALLELGSGFNPEFTGRENVYMNAAILGLTKEEIEAKYNDIADFADIGEFINQPVKTYSSGMYVRLVFAVATNVDPDILIIDEALSVGDMSFQKKCMEKIHEFGDEEKTLLFCSHDMHAISSLCHKAIWINNGSIADSGDSNKVISTYMSWMTSSDKSKIPGEQLSADNNPNYYVRNSEEVRILSVKLYDSGGSEKNIFFNGDDLIFEVTYDAVSGIKDPNYSVIIFRADKAPVAIGKASYEKGLKPAGMVKGVATFKVVLKNIQLNSGRYTFGISIWDKGNKISFANNISKSFEIKSLKIVFGPTEEKCVYFPEMEWVH